MPVEFLRDEQAARYGRYHADPSPEQLARFFYLSPQDIRFLADYRRSYTQLGCAVQPGYAAVSGHVSARSHAGAGRRGANPGPATSPDGRYLV